jgi:hypothetical protein
MSIFCLTRFNQDDLTMTLRIAAASILALAIPTPSAGLAEAGTAYDGSWSLSIVTERGACDGYNLPVQITNGNVTFPGLGKSSGHVSSDGVVRVALSASGKSASGSGKLFGSAGSGRWTGRSGDDHCSGSWTAQRF